MDTIKSLGDRLRQERERQGLTIEDIAQKTYIRKRYLEAVESGDHSVLPGEVYVKGFLRSYAEALGLNGWDFVAEYNRISGLLAEDKADPDADETSLADFESGATDAPRQRSSGRMMQNPIILPAKQKYLHNKSKQDRRIVGIIALVLLLVATYVVFVPNGVEAPGSGHSITESTIPSNLPAEGEKDLEPVVTAEPEATTASTMVTESLTSRQVITETVVQLPVNVLISASEDCWVEIYIDGKLIYTGIITAGSKYEAQGEQKVQVRFGNPGGVSVFHNGNPIGDIGRQVQTRVFTSETHYTIEDLRREEPPASENPDEAANQPELAGFLDLDEN